MGTSRGFGFLSYATAEEADAAVAGMNGQQFSGQAIYVALSHHNNDERRQRHRFNDFGNFGGNMYMPPMYFGAQPFGMPYGQPFFDQFSQATQPWNPYQASPFQFPNRLLNALFFQIFFFFNLSYSSVAAVGFPAPFPAVPIAGITPVAPSPDTLPKLTPEYLASIPEDRRKQVIGDHMFARIEVCLAVFLFNS